MPATTRSPSIGRSDSTAQRRTPAPGRPQPPSRHGAIRRDASADGCRTLQGQPVAPESCRTSFAAQCKTVKPHTPDPAAPPREKPRPETRNPPTHRTKEPSAFFSALRTPQEELGIDKTSRRIGQTVRIRLANRTAGTAAERPAISRRTVCSRRVSIRG